MAPRGTITVGRLHTLDSVRREMCRVYGEARRGKLDTGEASKLANVLSLIARLIEGGELERRIERLEAAPSDPEPWRAS
jgi:hypothetical protein